MKSDIISIDKQGKGFQDALDQAAKVAQFRELNHKGTMQLRLCAEELLSLARSVTGELQAIFWIESEGKQFDLHLSTKTVMDSEKRANLLAAATSRKNEAANTFLGRIRDSFESAMVSEPANNIPDEAMDDLVNHVIEIPEWDEMEPSVLKAVSDQVKIAIRGGVVDMTVTTHIG